MEKKVGVILPAAGAGLRFGEPKQFKTLGKRPLLFHSLIPFLHSPLISEIVVVVPHDTVRQVQREIHSFTRSKPVTVVAGGARRQDSVFAGVKALSADIELVVIHDAVRPFITEQMIAVTIDACDRWDGAIVALPARDTIKQVEPETGWIQNTLDRQTIWQAQTPQTFRRHPLTRALETAEQEEITGTDEACLLDRLGYSVKVVAGSPTNIKITTPEDWIFAEELYRRREQERE